MKRSHFRATLLLLSSVALSATADAQRAAPPADKTVLFVCEHGTVKSLLAKVLFDEYAKEAGLNMVAVSRGTKPDSLTPPWMVKALTNERVDLGTWRPQALRAGDLAAAAYVVSFDVPKETTAGARAPRVQWDSLPSVSQDFARGRDAIKLRVHHLVDSLKRARK